MQTPPQAQMSPTAPSTSPNFSTYTSTPELQGRSLERILDFCLVQCDGERLQAHGPDWPEAQGPSYHEVLGQPKNSGPMANMQQMQGQQGGAMPWQQHGQQFGMAQVPGGQAPMGYPQMMQQMQQRPQNAGGGAAPQQGQGQGQGRGMMAFQPQMMQGGQGMMAFQPQMMQGGQGMMPMGMNPAQFGGQGGQAMMVPMMMPAGQHPGNYGSS